MTSAEPADPLHRLAGSWEGDEDVTASQWTAAGTATSQVESRLEVGGLYLFQHYRQFRDGKTSFESRNVLGRDKGDGLIRYYQFDSTGFLPPAPAVGSWQDGVLRLVRSSPRGLQRTSFHIRDDDHYDLTIEFSPDGSEAGLKAMVTGRFRRIASRDMP